MTQFNQHLLTVKLIGVPVNINPWILERTAEYERDRIQRDMQQIRLEEEAMRARRTEEKPTQARLYRPRLLMRIVCTLVKLSLLRAPTRKTLRLSGSTGPCRG